MSKSFKINNRFVIKCIICDKYMSTIGEHGRVTCSTVCAKGYRSLSNRRRFVAEKFNGDIKNARKRVE